MNNNSPLISVIIPCYNVSAFVEKAIHSILKQTYKNLEVWIIDDASTDNTLKIIEAIKDDRIKVVAFKENTKKVGAVNEVLKKVNGDFIAFQDADDWSEPDRILKQLEEFKKDPLLGICFTNYRFYGNRSGDAKNISTSNEELRNEFLNFKYIREQNSDPTNCPSMMISKSALEKTSGYSPYFAGRIAEDVQWIYRILKFFKGITVNEVLYNYAVRTGSLMQMSSSGVNPKYSYSFQLLSKLIYKDVHEGIDALAPENAELLRKLELEACEQALVENVQLVHNTKLIYENSTNFKLGKFLLFPLRFLKKK